MDHKAKNARREATDGELPLEDLSLNGSLFGDAEDLVTFAQAYYATEFPRADKTGCPTLENLREAARSGLLPEDELREHLFVCSDCFRHFRSARREARQPVAPILWWRRFSPPAFGSITHQVVIAASVAGLVLCSYLALVFWRGEQESREVAMQYSAAIPALPPQAARPPAAESVREANPLTSGEIIQPPARGKATADSRRGEVVKRKGVPSSTSRVRLPTVAIDLEEYAVLRDVNEGEGNKMGQVIRLLPERRHLRLRLPEESRAGRYEINVVDAFGKTLVAAIGNSNNRTLIAILDLRGLAIGDYRLSIARTGEAPDYYLLRILDRSHHATKR